MYNEPVLFDDHPRGSDSQGLREIADALEERGIDAPSALYDEALELANEGHLGQARDRLRMLLCLDPHDGQAHLLLSKVMVAQGRFADALSQLDQAAACGVRAPQELRDQIEAGRQGELGDSQGERVAARANVELKTLREEARRLRSENAYLEQLTWDLTRKVRRWTATSAVIALTGTLLVGVTLFAGSGGAAATSTTSLADAVGAKAAPMWCRRATPWARSPKTSTVRRLAGPTSATRTRPPSRVASRSRSDKSSSSPSRG